MSIKATALLVTILFAGCTAPEPLNAHPQKDAPPEPYTQPVNWSGTAYFPLKPCPGCGNQAGSEREILFKSTQRIRAIELQLTGNLEPDPTGAERTVHWKLSCSNGCPVWVLAERSGTFPLNISIPQVNLPPGVALTSTVRVTDNATIQPDFFAGATYQIGGYLKIQNDTQRETVLASFEQQNISLKEDGIAGCTFIVDAGCNSCCPATYYHATPEWTGMLNSFQLNLTWNATTLGIKSLRVSVYCSNSGPPVSCTGTPTFVVEGESPIQMTEQNLAWPEGQGTIAVRPAGAITNTGRQPYHLEFEGIELIPTETEDQTAKPSPP